MGSQMPPEDELDRFSEFRMPHVIKRCTEDTGSTGGFKKCRADPIEDVMQYRFIYIYYIYIVVCVCVYLFIYFTFFGGHIFTYICKVWPILRRNEWRLDVSIQSCFFVFIFFGKNIPCLETTSPLEPWSLRNMRWEWSSSQEYELITHQLIVQQI